MSEDLPVSAEVAAGSESKTWIRVLGLVLVPLVLGSLLIDHSFVGRTLGCALILCGLYAASLFYGPWRSGLRESPRGQRVWTRLSWAGPTVCIVGLTLSVLWESVIGLHMPLSHDHPVHLARAWHFASERLAEGQLSGWSDLWFAGWPAGEDYPPGADMWITSFYLATFGLLGWESTYALAFFAMMSFSAWAFYRFGATYFGRGVGLAAAVFFLLDQGAYREGGWDYTVTWGVWPQVMATAFTMLSLAGLRAVIERARPGDFARAALCVGAALVSHPVAMLYLALAVPLFLVAWVLTDEKRAPGAVIARCLGALALGGALAAFWLLPYASKSDWMARYGELWASLDTMAEGLWNGTLFKGMTPVVLWLGLAGAVVGLRGRLFGALFLTGLTVVMLLVGSSTVFVELDLLGLSPAFGQIQFQRLSIAAKVCVYLLAGYGLMLIVSTLRQRSEERHVLAGWRRHASAVLALLCAAPFLAPLGEGWSRHWRGQIFDPVTASDVAEYEDYQAFLTWSAQKRAEETGFYRIAYDLPRHEHFYASAPIFNATPAYKVGFTPCTTFKHKPEAADPALYKLLSVKYVVAKRHQLGPGFEKVASFGPIRVFRFKDYSPERFTLQGPGRAELMHFDPEGEGVAMRVTGVAEGSQVVLHMAGFANWRATLDGQELPITETALDGEHKLFMTVDLPRDGTLEFVYTWPGINKVAAGLTWVALLLLFVILLGRLGIGKPLGAGLAERLSPIAQWIERRGLWLGALALLVPVAALGLRAAASEGASGRSVDFLDRLDEAEVAVVRGTKHSACTLRAGGRHSCSKQSWNFVGPDARMADGQLRRCIWAHPVERGVLSVRFPEVLLGSSLEGSHGRLDSAVRRATGSPVTLTVRVGEQVVGTFERPNKKGWIPWRVDTTAQKGQRHEVTFEITSKKAAVRHYCFDGGVVP